MKEIPLLRFIPFRRADIVNMCLAGDRLDAPGRQRFERSLEVIEAAFREEFHQLKTALKNAYTPLDPDADTRVVKAFREPMADSRLSQLLEQVLDRANYERVGEEAMQRALNHSSLFKVQLYVDMDDFEEVLLYTRGASRRREEVPQLFGLWRKEVEFTNFDRVVLYIRFKEDVDTESTLGGCQPGSTMLKLFQNVPGADLEMLFPNTRVGMRLKDKLLIGIPALVSGGVVLTTKMGATLVLLGSLLGFWLGVHSEPVTLDRAAVLALMAGIGALVGYLWKQFSKFRNRKLQYTQALTENLYFKLLDNNAGVLYRILDEAEDSEVKESALVCCFMLAHGEPATAAELDRAIEEWFAREWQCRLDFEIDDALAKLQRLGLAREEGGKWVLV
jgi:hypothetical protein